MIIVSLIFALVGLSLLGGGAWLITLGGSWYYALSGAVLLAVGVMLRRRRVQAQLLFAGLLVATAVWALWESGYDWWPLATRMGLLML
ncbi:MAG: membrane-bound PQQ-dependent dehydrogenase, glucose/quinate/shikimate family, partial [Pseudomonadota bacterium]|nr:membrane-bound PQQ-dependent dehydrogenase, glucose/quinate/shikimate family [Pseudomonadota bacterium]